MKTVKLLITIICFSISCSAFSNNSIDSMKDKNESWLQSRNNGSRTQDKDGYTAGYNDETPGVPVSDALPFLALLAGAYVFVLNKKKRTEV